MSIHQNQLFSYKTEALSTDSHELLVSASNSFSILLLDPDNEGYVSIDSAFLYL